jgi:ribosomal protein S18 acetylase RimI-like enzyme
VINISNSIQLKNITLDDHEILLHLMQEIYPHAYKHLWKHEDCDWYLNHSFNKRNLQKELTTKDTEYYFVMYNSNRVGIIRLEHNKPLNELPEKAASHIHRIYLSAETQGKGIANQLFNWAEKQAYKNGSEIVWLKAMDTQTQALRFYNKQNFVIINNYSLDFELMHKDLRGMVIMAKTL